MALKDVLQPTEDEEEATFVRKARARGFLCRKMNGAGYRGWLDQMVIGLADVYFIEFKRPGKYKDPHDGLSANQAEILEKLRALNKNVLVTDSADEALRFIGAI